MQPATADAALFCLRSHQERVGGLMHGCAPVLAVFFMQRKWGRTCLYRQGAYQAEWQADRGPPFLCWLDCWRGRNVSQP